MRLSETCPSDQGGVHDRAAQIDQLLRADQQAVFPGQPERGGLFGPHERGLAAGDAVGQANGGRVVEFCEVIQQARELIHGHQVKQRDVACGGQAVCADIADRERTAAELSDRHAVELEQRAGRSVFCGGGELQVEVRVPPGNLTAVRADQRWQLSVTARR